MLPDAPAITKQLLLPATPIVYKQGQEAYVLQPGDNLDIKFYYNPELNENVTIRPDGKISLQIIDELAGCRPHPCLSLMKH